MGATTRPWIVRAARSALCAAWLAVASPVGASPPAAVQVSAVRDAPAQAAFGERARWLAGRLLAPCCWNQTLDIHDSPVASALRSEIALALAEGSPPAAIEDALAARYGERIRAVPGGADPRLLAVLAVGVAMLVAAWLLVRRALRRPATGPTPPAPDDAAYEAALDAELSRLGP